MSSSCCRFLHSERPESLPIFGATRTRRRARVGVQMCLAFYSFFSQAEQPAHNPQHTTPPAVGLVKECLNLPASVNLDNIEAVKAFEDKQNTKQELAEENDKEHKLKDR